MCCLDRLLFFFDCENDLCSFAQILYWNTEVDTYDIEAHHAQNWDGTLTVYVCVSVCDMKLHTCPYWNLYW